MRERFSAPALALPAGNVEEIRAFLDGQSRIGAAVWVRHPQGTSSCHHLVLGIADGDWENGDMRTLEVGLDEGGDVPPLRLGPHNSTWVDILPRSEVEALRAFGTVLWERSGVPGENLDPLDFRLTYEPLEAPDAAVEALDVLLRAVPEIGRIEAARELLWKNGCEVRAKEQFWVGFEARRPEAWNWIWQQVDSALRESGVRPETSRSFSRLPHDERFQATVLYER